MLKLNMCIHPTIENSPKVQFNLVRDVKKPNRANKHDAGTDFFVPEYNA